MATVIIQQITPFDAGGSWLIKGTVDGTAHLMWWEKPFNPSELTPQAVAQAFLDDFARMDQLINNRVASRTVNITHPRSTTPIAVVFGNKASCYAQVGYDQVQITATVSSVSYSVILRQRDIVEASYARPNDDYLVNLLARMIADAYIFEGSWLGPFTNTFTATSTTSSSTTTTTTSSSTTTTTTSSSTTTTTT